MEHFKTLFVLGGKAMKEKTAIIIFVLFFTHIFSTQVLTKPVDVLLTPAEYGEPSRVIPIVNNKMELPEVIPVRKSNLKGGGPGSSPFSVDMVLAYDDGSEASSLGGLASGFHLGVWFQSPSACTLLQVYYYFYTGGAVTYYVSDPADSIDFENDYEEYHGGVNPGPNPIETYLHPEESRTAPAGWDTLIVPSMPDVAKDVFFAAYIMDDENSSPIIDASISPPYHTIMQRPGGGGGPFGWYSSWHHVYIRALVRMYENPPPMVESYDDLPDSYLTTVRKVTATFSDLGIPLDSTGVIEGWVHYRIDGSMWDSLSMYIISGDSAYGIWEATLPGINPGQKMDYYFSCEDMQGFLTVDPPPGNPASYTIREKTDDILFVNDDYYGGPYSYDVIGDVIPTADRWEIPEYGLPDSSVLLAGYSVIIWNTWEYSGNTFAAETTLISQYLIGGGNLLVSGMDIPAAEFGYSWGNYTTGPGEFLYEYFGIIGGTDDFASDTISVYFGTAGDTITGVFENWPITVMPYYFVGPGYNYNGRFDENIFNPLYWKGILADTAGNYSAFRYEEPGVYKVVWLYFPFAYIEDSANPYTPQIEQQQELIGRILTWFGETPAPVFENLTRYYSTVTPGPYPVSVTVTHFADSLIYVNLIVSANGVEDTIPMAPSKRGVEYTANIPEYIETTDIIYYVEAMDSDSRISSSETYRFLFLIPSTVLYVNESYDPVLDYEDVLDTLGISGGYNIYEPALYGIPDSTVLPAYSAVIWNGDWGYGTVLTKSSFGNVLYDYMVKGGNIFFNSDEILGLWDWWSNVNYYPGEFPYDVLKVDYIYNDVCYDYVYGVPGDTISDGISTGMSFPLTNWNDEVDILASAIEIFTNASGTTCRGVRWYDSNNKVVFLPFMYVSLPKNIQITVMRNVLTWFGIMTGISSDDNEDVTIPILFGLSQNRPNPFNKRTSIHYSIPKKTKVMLRIYNSAGRLVRTLVNGIEEPGYKSVLWNGRDKNNKKVAQGVYFYRLHAGKFRATRKLLVLR